MQHHYVKIDPILVGYRASSKGFTQLDETLPSTRETAQQRRLKLLTDSLDSSSDPRKEAKRLTSLREIFSQTQISPTLGLQ